MKKTFRIEGMTCSACSAAVERGTKRLEGVLSSEVNLATEKMNIEFDEKVVSEENIVEAVSKAGYQAIEDKEIRKVTIPIAGMT